MKIQYALLPIVMLTGCSKEAVLPDPASVTVNVKSQSGWKTESLNGDYSIQFPDDYEGNGMVGFEGPTFSKSRTDKHVTFSYFFCGPTVCSPYGESIPIPYPSILYPTTVLFATMTLDKSVAFKRNGQLQAVFYFIRNAKTQGVLYLADPNAGILKESVNVSYTYDLHSEVLGILQTIQPK